jgi:hypothetical protein
MPIGGKHYLILRSVSNEIVDALSFAVQGNQVLITRQPPFAAPSGGITADTQLRAKLIELYNVLTYHGLVGDVSEPSEDPSDIPDGAVQDGEFTIVDLGDYIIDSTE